MPSPSGTIFRLKGALICISFYDVSIVPVCSNDNSVENSQTTPPGPTSTTSRQRIQSKCFSRRALKRVLFPFHLNFFYMNLLTEP